MAVVVIAMMAMVMMVMVVIMVVDFSLRVANAEVEAGFVAWRAGQAWPCIPKIGFRVLPKSQSRSSGLKTPYSIIENKLNSASFGDVDIILSMDGLHDAWCVIYRVTETQNTRRMTKVVQEG